MFNGFNILGHNVQKQLTHTFPVLEILPPAYNFGNNKLNLCLRSACPVSI